MTATDSPMPRATDPAGPEAGWYDDPQAPGQGVQRWWNGVSWGDHTRGAAGGAPAAPTAVRVPPVPADYTGHTLPGAHGRGGHNGSAWWSFGLGLLSIGVGVLVLLEHHLTFWISTSGVIAIISGVRALRLRSQGLASAVVPAVVGIVAGSLGTLLMLLLLLVSTTGIGMGDGSSDGTGSAQAASVQAHAPSTLPDDALASYTDTRVKAVTTAAAGCGARQVDYQPLPTSSFDGTAARQTQEFIDLQVQPMSDALRGIVAEKKAWPSALDLDPQTRTLFVGAPSCAVLGAVPKGTDVHYAISPDGGQAALALFDPTMKVGSLWRSVDNTLYWL